MCAERAARQPYLWRLDAVPPSEQALQLALDGGIGGLHLEGALHVPDGIVELALVVCDNAHPDMRDKIIRRDHQDSLEDVHRRVVTLGFEIRLAKQAIRFQMFRVSLEDMAAVCNGFIEPLTLLDQAFNLAVVHAQ